MTCQPAVALSNLHPTDRSLILDLLFTAVKVLDLP